MNLVMPIAKNAPESPRRGQQKVMRPSELIVRRPSSATPNGRRHIDAANSPSAENLEFNQLRERLLNKSGVLCYNFERMLTTMDDFIDEGQLGAGTCGVVKQMRHKNRRELVMAVKQMRISSTRAIENKRIMMDLDVVTRCVGCANIVKCMGIFFSISEVWICMEVMSTSLDLLMRDTAEPFPEYVLGKIAVSIVKALDFLKKEHNMMHRDVKPSNMLLSFTGDIKLCDFGISGQLKDSIANSTQLGCIGYMAPERLEKFKYDVRADIWSLGVSLVELALKSFPYRGSQLFVILSKIIEDPPPKLPSDGRYTAEFRDFVDQCLTKDYVQRPKYPALRNTKLFHTYNREPFDVCDWYRSVCLKPPASPPYENGGTRQSLNSPASSTVTLSPDGSRTWLDDEGGVFARRNQKPVAPPLSSCSRQDIQRNWNGSGGGGTNFLRSLTPPRKDSVQLIGSATAHNFHQRPPPAVSTLAAVAARNNDHGGTPGGSSSRSRTLPPLGAPRSTPPSFVASDRPTAFHMASADGSANATDAVIMRNRGRPRVPTGSKSSEATPEANLVSSSAAAPASSIFMDQRRNPLFKGSNGDAGASLPPVAGDRLINTQTLQDFLNNIDKGTPPNSTPPPQSPLFYTSPRLKSTTENDGPYHQRRPLPQWIYSQTPTPLSRDASPSPRPPRSVSASGYSSGGGGRRIQRSPAYRLVSNPYEATRLGTNGTPIYTFSPSKRVATNVPSSPQSSSSNTNSEDPGGASGGGEADDQQYHHQYFWYSHK